MAAPTNTPLTGEIWHLSIDDLLAPLPAVTRLGGPGPFVINLSASTAPIALPERNIAGCEQACVYQLQRTEDRRPRYRLRLGPFGSEDDADAILKVVRDIYPGALTATADADDLRAIAALRAKLGVSPSPAEKPSAAVEKPPATAEKASATVERARASFEKLTEELALVTDSMMPAPPVVPPRPAEKPAASAAPMVPTTPAFSAAPAVPAKPTAPAAPTVSNAPAAPTKSTAPTTPASSAAPAVPAKPTAPAAPTVSNAPAAPTKSTAPTTPASSAAPAAPAKPTAPAAPTMSNAPAAPTKSTAPTTPASSAAPAVPAKPTAPAAPTMSNAPAAMPTANAPVPRSAEPAVKRASSLDATQTVRALTQLEEEDTNASRWFVIQLSQAEEPFDPDTLPNLDIFSMYRLYSVAGIDQGRILHALRLGFFTEEISAAAVASYLAAFYDKPTVKRVSSAERDRFAEQSLEPRKDVGATGRHAAIEITSDRFVRERRTGRGGAQ